jgi:glycosyltransferase involved in cell wall biosynthesis
MITTFFPPYSFGGDATFVYRLSNELGKRGHHVEIIHCVDSYNLLAQGETLRPFEPHPNVTVHRLKSPWGALSPLATQQTGRPLFKTKEIERILAKGFDVIHYHNISLVGGPKILEMGDAVKLYTTHEYWLVCPMNVLFRYDGVACSEKRCLRCTLAYGRPPQWWRYSNMLEAAVKHIDMMLHPSPFSLKKHRELGLNVPAMVMPDIHSPILGSAPEPRDDSAVPYFLFVGRFEKLKGAHTLIPLFRKLPTVRLVLVGEGSQRAELVALAKGCSNIEIKEWMRPEELAGLYRDAVALIIPSLCYENFPLVVLEAQTQQTPVIGRRLGSLPDLLTEEAGGLTYGDEEELCSIVGRLVADPAWRNQLGINGYVLAQNRFSVEEHLAKYFEVIETVRAGKKSRRGKVDAEK